MDKKKVLITGITGFAGSHLAEYLISKGTYTIFGTHFSDRHLDNISAVKEQVKLYKVNLLNAHDTSRIVGEIRPDIIYHLAASSSVAEAFKKPNDVITNNVGSEVNVLESVKKHNLAATRIIIISSSHVYGFVASSELPIDEFVAFKPDNPYAVSKITQDYLGLSYYLAYKMDIIRLRPFNHIGPRLSMEISISRFAKKIAEIEKGRSTSVIKVGNLEAKRDFTDVRDMVKAYWLASLNCTSGEVYNIGTGVAYSIKEMLDKLLKLSSVKIILESDQFLFRPSDIPELRCNAAKFQRSTGWKPSIPIETTLQDILDYWRKVI